MSADGPRLAVARVRIFYTHKSKVIAYVTMACTCAGVRSACTRGVTHTSRGQARGRGSPESLITVEYAGSLERSALETDKLYVTRRGMNGAKKRERQTGRDRGDHKRRNRVFARQRGIDEWRRDR